MKNLKVVKVESESIEFEGGVILQSHHESDCCERHYLSFADLTMTDFDGLEFDLSNDDFFKRVEDYGIVLVPTNGQPISVPGYGSNNGYYSTQLDLCLSGKGFERTFDITSCQVISD